MTFLARWKEVLLQRGRSERDGDFLGVFPRESYWGNRITFMDWENKRVVGWIGSYATDGDTFAFEMQSGRLALFKLVDVDNQVDPSDMFFADAEFVSYVEDDEGE